MLEPVEGGVGADMGEVFILEERGSKRKLVADCGEGIGSGAKVAKALLSPPLFPGGSGELAGSGSPEQGQEDEWKNIQVLAFSLFFFFFSSSLLLV